MAQEPQREVLLTAADAKIARIIASLSDRDVMATPEELIIRNHRELFLIREFRARELQRQETKAKAVLSQSNSNDQKGHT